LKAFRSVRKKIEKNKLRSLGIITSPTFALLTVSHWLLTMVLLKALQSC